MKTSAQEQVYPNLDQQTRHDPQWWTRPPDDWTPEELEAQRAAREAVLQNQMFPELLRGLTSILGPTAELLMLHHLIYWMNHRLKPKMEERWWMWKTLRGKGSWYEETRLNRKQVERGRARLVGRGLIRTRRGPRGVYYYCVDWLRLARALGVAFETTSEWFEDEEDFDYIEDLESSESRVTPLKGVQSQNDPPLGGTVQSETPLGDATQNDPPKGDALSKHERTQESTSGEDNRRTRSYRSPLASLAALKTEDILKNTSTSTPPLQPDVEPDSAKEEGSSEAPPLSPEDERALAARVRAIVLTEPGLKDAARKSHRAGRIEDVATYVTGVLADLGEEATPEHVRAVLPDVLAELEEEEV